MCDVGYGYVFGVLVEDVEVYCGNECVVEGVLLVKEIGIGVGFDVVLSVLFVYDEGDFFFGVVFVYDG